MSLSLLHSTTNFFCLSPCPCLTAAFPVHTCVDSLVEVDESLLGNLEAALDDGLALLELALGHPLGQLGAGLGEVLGVVEHDETFEADAHGDDLGECPGTLGFGCVVLAHDAALDEAGVGLSLVETHVEDLAADYVCVS